MKVFVLLDEAGHDDSADIVAIFASREALENDPRSTPRGWGSPVRLIVEEWNVIE
jgi:hypothetical protein